VNVKNGLVHVLGVKEMVLIMLVLVNQLDLLDAEFLKHAHVIFIQHVVNVLIAYIVHGVEVEIKNVLKELIVTLAQCQQLIAHATLTKNCDTCRSDYSRSCQWCQSLRACINSVDTDACTDPPSNITSSCQSYCKGNAQDCHSCNRLPGCTWCKDLTGDNAQSCIDPLVSTCNFMSHTCAICGESAYCSDCTQKSGCVWFSNIQACRQRGSDPSCTIPHGNSCDVYCKTASTCDTCSKRIGCGWCTSAQECVDAATSSCATAHTCPSGGGGGHVCKTCGFDGGSFVGGMFLVIGLIVLLVGGYLFFKWKTTRRVSYTELR